jgi:hypothetical protein
VKTARFTTQALEALKVAGGFGTPLIGRMATFDASDGTFYSVALRPRRRDCEVCGSGGSAGSSSSGVGSSGGGGGNDSSGGSSGSGGGSGGGGGGGGSTGGGGGGSIMSMADSARWCEDRGLGACARLLTLPEGLPTVRCVVQQLCLSARLILWHMLSALMAPMQLRL